MAARACPTCQTAFRDTSDFKTCPLCGVATVVRHNRASSLVHDETRERYFEAYCERREEARTARGEPSPEELGAIEARDMIAEFRSALADLEAGRP